MTEDFYRAFEDRLRGSRELIKSRLAVYLPFVRPLGVVYPKAAAVDIGCGRGEWLELLRDAGIPAIGVDLDEGMLAACRERGLSIQNNDALSYLKSLQDESQIVVSGFHIIEHIPFAELQLVVQEALRVLKPGGLLILETPNPENIIVGTANFYLDPTHQKPIPPPLLSFLAEHYGFARTKTLRLQEPADLKEREPRLIDVFYGASPDYAIVAQKTGSKQITALLDAEFEKEYGLTHEVLADRFEKVIAERIRTVEAQATQAEAQATQAEAQATQAEAQATQAEAHATQAEARATQAEARVSELLASSSWRMTAPFRMVGHVVKSAILLKNTKSELKEKPTLLLAYARRYVKRRPKVKRIVLGMLKPFPALRERLDGYALEHAYVPSRLFPSPARGKILYVDISDLVQKDLRTGIQRVTRSIAAALLNNPPTEYQVKLVYATGESHGYLHANRYTQRLTGLLGEEQEDIPIAPQPNDIFLGLDFVVGTVVAQQKYLKWMRGHGVHIYFVVYDLLPVQLPRYFPKGAESGHQQWLQIIAGFDGAICISQAVKDDLDTWLRANCPQQSKTFVTDWFHLGADVENSIPTKGMDSAATEVLKRLSLRPSFLMVGTIEPRKGHKQVLAAFDCLWADKIDVNLVIVGKLGWMMDDLAKQLRQHPEFGQRLYWLEGISDEYLEKAYAVSTCLLAPSEAEGFGLPLIEAAQHNKFIIARDIPVFREVAGEFAFYFKGKEPEALASAVKTWLKLLEQGKAPASHGMPWLTWQESTELLLSRILVNSNAGFAMDVQRG